MSDNLGRTVKWQDDEQGWHTGRVVMNHESQGGEVIGKTYVTANLVRESCDGRLAWVERSRLQDWVGREEWEK